MVFFRKFSAKSASEIVKKNRSILSKDMVYCFYGSIDSLEVFNLMDLFTFVYFLFGCEWQIKLLGNNLLLRAKMKELFKSDRSCQLYHKNRSGFNFCDTV